VVLNYEKKYNRSVGKVVLTGGGVMLKGILPVAQEKFGTEVVMGNPFERIEAPAFLQNILADSGPEFAWTADSCHACIDLDKVMGLKDQKVYSSFWNTPFLKIRVLDGKTGDVECTKNTYPGCNTISLVNVSQSYRSQRAYAALCRLTSQGTVCSLGTISIGAKIT
jgi:cell division ATPase FtsA